MDQIRMTKKIFENKPEGRREAKRSTLRWLEEV
jgi:hypothetical protein